MFVDGLNKLMSELFSLGMVTSFLLSFKNTQPYFTSSSRNSKFIKANGTIFEEKYFQIVSICVSIYNGLCNILNQIRHHGTMYLLEAHSHDLGQSVKSNKRDLKRDLFIYPSVLLIL